MFVFGLHGKGQLPFVYTSEMVRRPRRLLCRTPEGRVTHTWYFKEVGMKPEGWGKIIYFMLYYFWMI